MKRFLLSLICVVPFLSFAQNPTYQQKLYYTCKVWGFAKYYHSRVSNCMVNWDSVLVKFLPDVKAATTTSDFNNVLDSILAAAGPMALSVTPFPDVIPPELKRNRNWGWTHDAALRNDVQIQLDTIKNNFRPHASCRVEENMGSTGGLLRFPNDSPLVNINTTNNFPDEAHRLLLLFKHWNIIHYFNPYNYVLDKSIDDILNDHVIAFADANSASSLYFNIELFTTELQDAHVEGMTYSSNYSIFNGAYAPRLLLRYMENKYVVVKSGVNGIAPGDAITSVDGNTISYLENFYKKYISAGNDAVLRREIATVLLAGGSGTNASIAYEDSTGASKQVSLSRNTYIYGSWFADYYYTDSLKNVSWTKLGCDIPYVNIGNATIADIDDMYNAMYTAPAIIMDIRNYPSDASVWEFGDLAYAGPATFARLTIPDVTYPGTYTWYNSESGLANNPTPYQGKVIVLMNEQTQSAAEYDCMILDAMPDVVKIGSQTAGADGDVTYFDVSDDINTGFTSVGVYYPNGDSTQRIGIVPDIVYEPTREGVRHKRDEVLEKAIRVACNLSVPDVNSTDAVIRVYPNPATDIVNIKAGNIEADNILVTVTDVTGRALIQKNFNNSGKEIYASLDIKSLASGMYLLTVQAGSKLYTTKIVKQ